MLTRHIRPLAALAIVLAIFSGRLLDTTTGQPLVGVTVSLSGPSAKSAKTDKHGRFTVTGLPAGTYHVLMQSPDVPQQSTTVTLHANQTTVLDIKLCSTTLDYHCGGAGGGSGA